MRTELEGEMLQSSNWTDEGISEDARILDDEVKIRSVLSELSCSLLVSIQTVTSDMQDLVESTIAGIWEGCPEV